MFDIVSTYQHFHTIFYDFKIMNWSLTTLSLPVIGDWGLSNVFSFLNIVKQFLVLTCLVLCLCQPALHQYISLYSIISLTYSLSIYKIKENVKLVYWFIGLSARSNRINNIMYHVESPVEEP